MAYQTDLELLSVPSKVRGIVQQRAHTVLIGDIVGSKRIQDYAATAERFAQLIDDLPTRLPGIVLQADITGGDEFKATVKRPSAAWELITYINEHMRPHRLRYGVGYGAIEALPRSTPIGRQNGAAFHHARDAIEEAKKRRTDVQFKGLVELRPDLGIQIPHDDTISLQVSLIEDLRRDWTGPQRAAIKAYEEHGTQQEAARSLGHDNHRVVGRLLQRSRYDHLQRLQFHTVVLMDLLWGSADA